MNEQIKNQLAETKNFVSAFVENMTSDSMNDSAKQAYFLDNQAEIKKTFGFLNNLNSLYESIVSEDTVLNEDAQTYDLINELIETLSNTLNAYREGLKTNPNITKEDTTVVVNEETLKQAMEEDSSTKKMVDDMNALAAQNAFQNGEYNYMIVVSKTQPYYVSVNTKEQLIGTVNRMADSVPGATIEVFEIKYTSVPLKTTTKTIYTL